MAQRNARPAPAISDADSDDLRCLCGRLVARLVPGGVEIRCHRCKRPVILPLQPESPVRKKGEG